jgi:transcription factor TFIIIB component B''
VPVVFPQHSRGANVGIGQFGHQCVFHPVERRILAHCCTDKSGKKFAPRAAPGRRPAPSTSTQTSARPSVDRQVQSQTPQPQAQPQRVAASRTPSTSLPTPASTQPPVTAAPRAPAQKDVATLTAIPPGHVSSPSPTSVASVVPQKRPSEPGQISQLPSQGIQARQESQVSEPTSRAAASDVSNALPSDTSPTANPSTAAQKEASVPALTGAPTSANAPVVNNAIRDTEAPAAKRRRIEKPLEQTRNARPTTADADANVPLPTTDNSEVMAEGSNRAAAPSASKPAKQAKKPRVSAKAKRTRQIEEAAAEVVAEATQGPSAKAKKPRKNAKGKGVQRDPGTTSETLAGANEASSGQIEGDPAPTKPKRKYTRKKKQRSAQDTAAEIVEDAVQGSSKDPANKGRRKKRAATPEGAETITIEPSEMKMADLCRDSRTGRVSKREIDLRELERAEFVRKKQRELQELMGQVEPENEAPVETADERIERLRARNAREESVAQNVPNTIIVNGEIRIDEDSLQIDRHAAAAEERAGGQLDSIEESDLTRKMNQGTYMKRDKSGGWNELLTERFYDGLRMFGTDFEMISKMFPGRTRHKVKLKFVKEEKLNLERIKATLLGEKLAVDLPDFEKMAGTEFDDPEELEREIEEDRKRLEEETAQEKQAMEEQRKEREDFIANEGAAGGGETTAGEESSTKENRGRKGKKKGPKRKKGEPKKRGKRARRAAANAGVEVPVED